MKNVTFSADEKLIEAARARAREEGATLNGVFRRWLEDYARQQERGRQFDQLAGQLRGRVRVGRKLDRDEMNAR